MAAPTLYSALYGDATLWDDPTPDYDAIMAAVGGASTANRDVVRTRLLNLSARSPVVLAFTLTSDLNHIYVGHSPTVFPA